MSGSVTFEIRELTPADSLEDLTKLINLAYAELMSRGWNMTGCYQDVVETRDRLSSGRCFVAEVDGRVIGTGMINFGPYGSEPALYQQEETAVFGQFAVDPGFRSLRIGEALMSRAEEEAARLGYKTMALDTVETADYLIEYYQRRGFRIVDTVQWPGKTYRSVVMAKALELINHV